MATLNSLVTELLSRYLAEAPMVAEHAAECPEMALQMTVMTQTLHHAATAMETEGIGEETQRRILCTAVYGTPDEEQGLAVVRERIARAEAAHDTEELLRQLEDSAGWSV